LGLSRKYTLNNLTVKERKQLDDGAVEIIYENGAKEVLLKNGMKKRVYTDGVFII